jgi:hypothetical protein
MSGQLIAKVSGEIVDIAVPTSIKILNSGNPMAVTAASGGQSLLSASCVSVTVKALSKNTGDIYVGGSAAGNMPYSGQGFCLEAGEAVNFDIDNTGKVWVCAVVSGDRVCWAAV